MTNSEAIKQLKERYDIGQKEYLNFAQKYIESLKMAMESLEENTKLKAEIERLKEDYSVLARQYNNVENSSIRYYNEVKQLKAELEQWQSTNLKLVCELTRIECENNQLKAELEQSVNEKAEVISKIEYALNECEPIYNGCAFIPQAKPIYDLAMNYCLDLLKGQV